MQDDSLQDDRCKLIIFKIVQFARLQATNECVKDEKRTVRPHKLPQSAPVESVEGGVKISKTCLPPIGPLCLPKVLEEG